MQLTAVDWSIIVLYFLLNIAIGLYYRSRAGTSTSEYFLSGRNVPWWLAGTSMVATTFAADTPLAVTGMSHAAPAAPGRQTMRRWKARPVRFRRAEPIA